MKRGWELTQPLNCFIDNDADAQQASERLRKKVKHRKSARQPIFGAFFYLDLTQLVTLNYAETARMVLFGKILY